jgi:hypothetical protein
MGQPAVIIIIIIEQTTVPPTGCTRGRKISHKKKIGNVLVSDSFADVALLRPHFSSVTIRQPTFGITSPSGLLSILWSWNGR